MYRKLQIISASLLDAYRAKFDQRTAAAFNALKDSDLSADNFSFYTSVSAVYSSRIEGEDIQLDSYIKHKRLGAHFQPDYTRKTDDLYDGYTFAQANPLTEKNIHSAHAIITRHILQLPQQGAYRRTNMYVLTSDGKIEYVAAEPSIVSNEMSLLTNDINELLRSDLSVEEVFYFAAMIHLVFVKIHPYEDGNGRTGRLLEKWFLSHKLGAKAWFVQSEKYYYTQHLLYYTNLRALGLEYSSLDYSKALPFLLMLPSSLLS